MNKVPTDVSPYPLSWVPYLSDNEVRCVHWIMQLHVYSTRQWTYRNTITIGWPITESIRQRMTSQRRWLIVTVTTQNQNQKQQQWQYSCYIGCSEILFIQITATFSERHLICNGAACCPTPSHYVPCSKCSSFQRKNICQCRSRLWIRVPYVSWNWCIFNGALSL